jgi:predicted AlkP superfamily phosphohydrolase/phosphomutase
MTGKNPGQTGIYDFLHRFEGSYRFAPNNTSHVDGKTLWRLLSESGRRVGVVNVPLTYPVEEVNGFLVAGWLTPYNAADYTHPPGLAKALERELGGYPIYPQTTYRAANPRPFFDACHRLAEVRTDAALYLMRRDEWDLFMCVYFDTDRVLHQLWHLIDEGHPQHPRSSDDPAEPLRQYFLHLDRQIARLLDEAGDDTLVVVMSDHGMGRATDMIVLNAWLLEEGCLALRTGAVTRVKKLLFDAGLTLRTVHRLADRLRLAKHAEYKVMYSADRLLKALFLSFNDVDWSRSVAYSFGRSVGPVYVNLRGREPGGIVQPGAEYEEVRDRVERLAARLRHPATGRPLVSRVRRREEIWSGPHLNEAPDLVLEPADPATKFFGLSDFGSNRVVEPMYRYTGMHRQHGMLLLHGPSVRAGATLRRAAIVDVVPTVLQTLGVAIPSDLDGRPLAEAFEDGWDVARSGTKRSTTGRHADEYSAEAASEIEDRLRKLGYLG